MCNLNKIYGVIYLIKRIFRLLFSICFSFSLVFCFSPFVKAAKAPIDEKSQSYILMDADSGKILAAKDENKKLYPASVTKIMSLLLVAEALDNGKFSFNTELSASPDACSKGGSQIWLKEGETMTVDDLLKATVIGSANDACVVLAEAVAGSESAFVSRMNERAQELGMKNTHFENATGLDDTATNHLTTAKDIAIMSRALLSHSWITKYSTVWMDTLRNGETELTNTNKLVRFYDGCTGLKTGTTSKAGSCLSASAKRDNTHLIAVVMGAPTSKDRFSDAKALLNYGFASFVNVPLLVDESLVTEVHVKKALETSIKPVIPPTSLALINVADANKIEQKVTLALDVTAPVVAGQVLGKVDFFAGNELVKTVNLVAPDEIREISLLECFKLFLSGVSK